MTDQSTAGVALTGWPRTLRDARYEIGIRPDQEPSVCPFCDNHMDQTCDVVVLGGDFLALAHTACVPEECEAAIPSPRTPASGPVEADDRLAVAARAVIKAEDEARERLKAAGCQINLTPEIDTLREALLTKSGEAGE